MKAYCCKICGYVHFGDDLPEICPQCGANKDFFYLRKEKLKIGYVSEQRLGIAKETDKETVKALRKFYEKDSLISTKYFTMSRVADRDGYPEIANVYRRFAIEKLQEASKVLELLGDDIASSTMENIDISQTYEENICRLKNDISKYAAEECYDSIQCTIAEQAKESGRRGKAFEGILKRYFNK